MRKALVVLALALLAGTARAEDNEKVVSIKRQYAGDTSPNFELALVGLKKVTLHTKVSPYLYGFGANDHVVEAVLRKTLTDAGLQVVDGKDCGDDCSGVWVDVLGGGVAAASDSPRVLEVSVSRRDDDPIRGANVQLTVGLSLRDDAPIRGAKVHVIFYEDSDRVEVAMTAVKPELADIVRAQANRVVGYWFAANKPKN